MMQCAREEGKTSLQFKNQSDNFGQLLLGSRAQLLATAAHRWRL
jgi:hypothetical protein